MKITTKGRYAVSALVELAMLGNNKTVALDEIAKRCSISTAYLLQLFSKIRQAGIVEGIQGPNGGYRIAKPLESISIADIISAVDESIETRTCKGLGNCNMGENRGADSIFCRTHNLWENLMRNTNTYLNTMTLQSLCDSNVRCHTDNEQAKGAL